MSRVRLRCVSSHSYYCIVSTVALPLVYYVVYYNYRFHVGAALCPPPCALPFCSTNMKSELITTALEGARKAGITNIVALRGGSSLCCVCVCVLCARAFRSVNCQAPSAAYGSSYSEPLFIHFCPILQYIPTHFHSVLPRIAIYPVLIFILFAPYCNVSVLVSLLLLHSDCVFLRSQTLRPARLSGRPWRGASRAL